MKGRLCCIFNYAPHYRYPIFQRIGKSLDAFFFFGDKLKGNIELKKLDYSSLTGFRKELRTHFFGPFEWTGGWLSLAFDKQYGVFLISKNYYAFNQWLFLLFCRILKKPVYAWMHGMKSDVASDNGSPTTLFLARCYDKLLTGTFLYGERAKNNMIAMGYAPDKLHVIYNSLDYDAALSLRTLNPHNPFSEHFGNDAPVIVFIGRLLSNKRLDLLVDAYRILKSAGFAINVAFIGDGPQQISISSSIGKSDIADFWFVGPVYDENQIHRFLYNATLCVSPGNVGLTAVHSMSHGLPVITNDDFNSQMPEYEAIIRGFNGDFFKNGDAGSLARTIRDWIENHTDREAVRKNCYKVVDEKYNPDYQLRVLKEVILGR